MATTLTQLATDVLKNYDITGKTLKVIQSGTIKTVWKVEGTDGSYCLKRLNKPMEVAQFTINAQKYIHENGGLVASVYDNKKGEPITEYNGQLFVLYQWLPGRNVILTKPADLKITIQGIAKFHQKTRGYQPPGSSRISSKLGRWPEHYRSMRERLVAWKSAAGGKGAFYKLFRENADKYIAMALEAEELLGKSVYTEWVKKLEKSPIMTHQDYGEGNCLAASEGVYILDLDGLTYDLPIRDLRKMVNQRMANRGSWDKDLLHRMVTWYKEANPLSDEELRVLYIDLWFPHQFHDTSKNVFLKGKPGDAGKLREALRIETSKVPILRPLLGK